MKLFKLLTATLLVMVMGACSSCAHNGQIVNRQPSTLVQHLYSSTVALVFQYNTDDGEKYHTYCSGVWIDKDLILTANHCMKGLAKMEAEVKSDNPFEDPVIPSDLEGLKVHYAVVQEANGVGNEPLGLHLATAERLSPDFDLALVVADGAVPEHQVAVLADESPAIGEKVYVVGHPGGLIWTYTQGWVSAYRDSFTDLDIEGPFMQVEAPVWFGNSGGGAFDTDGRLIGIASFIARTPEAGFFIHANNIRKFLNQDDANQKLKRVFTLPGVK